MRKTRLRAHGIAAYLAAAAAMLIRPDNPAPPFILTCAYLCGCTFSLGAPDAFSRAASKLMSTKKLMGALLTAIFLILLGTAALGYSLYTPGEPYFSADFLPLVLLAAAGGVMAMVTAFEELFVSQGDKMSAWITDALAFIALTAAIILPVSDTLQAQLALAGSGGALVIGGAISLGFSRKELPRPGLALFKEIPAALVRTMLAPALLVAANVFFEAEMTTTIPTLTMILALITVEMSKSTFRRSRDEASGLKTKLPMTLLTASLALCTVWFMACGAKLPFFERFDKEIWASLPHAMMNLLIGGACAMILYAPFDWNSILSALLMLGAAAVTGMQPLPTIEPMEMNLAAAAAAMIVTNLLMIPEWNALSRQARAMRIRKKAMKGVKKPSF